MSIFQLTNSLIRSACLTNKITRVLFDQWLFNSRYLYKFQRNKLFFQNLWQERNKQCSRRLLLWRKRLKNLPRVSLWDRKEMAHTSDLVDFGIIQGLNYHNSSHLWLISWHGTALRGTAAFSAKTLLSIVQTNCVWTEDKTRSVLAIGWGFH